MTGAGKRAMVALLLVAACRQPSEQMTCPDPQTVASPTIGAAFVNGLTGRLAGPDRENMITEALAEIQRRDPTLDKTTIINIMVAAECPNVFAKPDHDPKTMRARIALFRAQVMQLLSGQ